MDIRLSTFTWPFPFLVRLGWATAGVTNPKPEVSRGRVFLLRGNGVIFSRGMGWLCGQLRRAGFWAEDLRCVGDRWVCRWLLAEKRRGRLKQPIIFIGHSCGGRYSLHAAKILQKANIPVDLLICIDVALPPLVPANVRRAINLYLAGPRIYPTRPLMPSQNSQGPIENFALNGDGIPVASRNLCHLNITASQGIQAFVLKCIEETVPKI